MRISLKSRLNTSTFTFTFISARGPGYAFSPMNLEVAVGDVIHWKWSLPDLVQNVKISVEQTLDSTKNESLVGGFRRVLPAAKNGWYLGYTANVQTNQYVPLISSSM